MTFDSIQLIDPVRSCFILTAFSFMLNTLDCSSSECDEIVKELY